MINFFINQFSWYGFFIGLAIVISLEIFQKKIKELYSKNNSFPENNFWKLVGVVLVTGIFGGRLWYLLTNFWLVGKSLNTPQQAIAFWQGGMSILGAVLFGFFGLWWAQKKWFPKLSVLSLTDALVLALPLSQAIGRLGNWANQELYGLPTNLPWGIYISLENRVEPFLNNTHFHPLFAYEALLMLGVFVCLWWLLKNKKTKLGEGQLTGVYLISYMGIRFLLDFLRVQKHILVWVLGLNQIILLSIWFFGWIFYFFWKYSLPRKESRSLFKKFLVGLVIFISLVFLLMRSWNILQLKRQHRWLLSVPDHSVVDFKINGGWSFGERKLRVEVANTSESITQGLSDRKTLGEYREEDRDIDGMLFVFSQKRRPIFWMKDMRFEIDMIWLDDNEIVGLEREVPFPGDSNKLDEDLLRYSPQENINFVLETVPFKLNFSK